ncbi:hypothetical protein FF38_02261 [Lucilia cuprina]|uniref:Uncharacterized protein n=1 Tax=Lucilia cuprina TaxID=7375 RepID=A0A0L0CIN6_LUCCU|nr:hypothetical protein CVS40_1420 [Lucilia cuprina]KNC32072.1 hypothetical protein FF38_02261 [Lucilia cuprina]
MQSLNHFKCRTNCKHKECQRHAYLGVVDRNETPECSGTQQELTGSSIFLENVIDLSHTLAQIMILCGIHECKAKTSVDIITYSLLHYDLVCYCLDATPTKRLRKEDIFHELGRKCLMNRVEAHLCYNIIKRGFKAFYYRPQGQEGEEGKENDKPSFSQECVYVHAAKKTAEAYAQFEGLSCDEQRGVEAKIMVVYKKFYDRLQTRQAKPAQEDCNCCFCAKTRGHLVYGQPPPCTESPVKKSHTCSHCCKKKKSLKLIHPRTTTPKCPVCHRSRNFCTCAKYEFNLQWIGSIWSRPDMQLYYEENIMKEPVNNIYGCSLQCGEEKEGLEERADVVMGENK